MSIHVIRLSNPESTVSFCEKRLVLELAQIEMKKHAVDCLAPGKRDKYVALARSGDYNPVLAAIWRDKTNRFEFVKLLEGELHAPIMFEAVILEFAANPTAQTVREICLPLLGAAAFRVRQDAQCAADHSVFDGDAYQRMTMTYKESLKNRVEKELKDPNSALFGKYDSIQAIIDEDKASVDTKIAEKGLWTARTSKEINLPPPDWIGQSGMGVFIRQFDPNRQIMHPSSEHKKIRDAQADLYYKV